MLGTPFGAPVAILVVCSLSAGAQSLFQDWTSLAARARQAVLPQQTLQPEFQQYAAAPSQYAAAPSQYAAAPPQYAAAPPQYAAAQPQAYAAPPPLYAAPAPSSYEFLRAAPAPSSYYDFARAAPAPQAYAPSPAFAQPYGAPVQPYAGLASLEAAAAGPSYTQPVQGASFFATGNVAGASQDETAQLGRVSAGVDKVTELARRSIERASYLQDQLDYTNRQMKMVQDDATRTVQAEEAKIRAAELDATNQGERARGAESIIAAKNAEVQQAIASQKAAEQRAAEAEKHTEEVEMQAVQAIRKARSEVETQAVQVIRKARGEVQQAQAQMQEAQLRDRQVEVQLQQAQADAIQARAAQAAAEEQVARAAVVQAATAQGQMANEVQAAQYSVGQAESLLDGLPSASQLSPGLYQGYGEGSLQQGQLLQQPVAAVPAPAGMLLQQQALASR